MGSKRKAHHVRKGRGCNMTYIINTKFGATYEITEETKETINKILLRPREERPQFILISEANITINTDVIAVIEPKTKASW